MTTGDRERVKTITATGASTESYSYDIEGRVSSYTMTDTSRSSYPMETSYLYDTANRLKEVRYPAQYGLSGNPRKTVKVAYDTTSRLKDLKVNNVAQMDQIAYNHFGQATSRRIGGGSANPLTEQYTFDADTGLMTNQKVKRGSTSLMDMSYNYDRLLSKGSVNGTTGNLTHIIDNLDRNKDRKYEYDTLGRLIKAKGGTAAGGSGTANWTQDYTYDRYGNKLTTTKSGVTTNSAAIPLDGLASQAYQAASNRITTSGHEYDYAGNMIRGKAPDGSIQRFEYDESGRLVKIKTDAGVLLEEYTYGTSRQRLRKTVANGDRTYYAWGGSSALVEYSEASDATALSWAKSYIYAGSRLLSTITKSGTSEVTEYHHPDRLGTKLITNTVANTAKEQATLPFGTSIDAETQATSNQRFTSYDRSESTGLDYAVNRTYNSGQSRFTQVDPIGMASADIGNPQSMNLFAYVENNPVDFIDPSGLDGCAFFLTDQETGGVVCVVSSQDSTDGRRGVGGVTTGAIEAVGVHNEFEGGGGGGQIGKRAGLSFFDSLTYLLAVYRILQLLENSKSDCYKYLNSLGFAPGKIVENLLNSTPYDGTRSTNFSENDPTGAGISIKDEFEQRKQVNGRYPRGLTSPTGKNIYYSRLGLNVQTVIHENIHGTNKSKTDGTVKVYDPTNPKADPITGVYDTGILSAISDREIQQRMGLPANSTKGSTGIDGKLKENGCK